MPDNKLPYEGVRIVEFTHMVMGPTCGMVLADLGAEVIKVEPIAGDNTRKLLGSGAGFFPLFNRNKKSIALDLQSALFENNVFLVAQHMMQFAVTGKPAAPMPGRISAWAVYDVFTVKDGEQIFLAAVSDTQWAIFCDAFGFADLKVDPRLKSNNDRVLARDWMIPILRSRLADSTAAELSAIFEKNALPFAPITRPEDLFDDPHLNATGGLAPLTLPDGRGTMVPLLPLTLGGERPGVRSSPPKLGQHTGELLSELGYTADELEVLRSNHVILAD
jgi:crotonobetainyl-CoA:carnitine CoA-transferase CaiB-like acyl-CoA transferase